MKIVSKTFKTYISVALTTIMVVAMACNPYKVYGATKLSTPKIVQVVNIAGSEYNQQQIITIKYSATKVKAEIYRAEANGEFKRIAITSKKVYKSKTVLRENCTYKYKVRLVKTVKGKKLYSKFSLIVAKTTDEVYKPKPDEEWGKDDLNHNGIPDWDETNTDIKGQTEDEKRQIEWENAMQNDPSPENADINVILALVNKERKNLGLQPLVLEEGLVKVAKLRAKEINPLSNGIFSHIRPNGTSYLTAFTEMGLGGNRYSENICGADSSKESFYIWWFSTKGHKENMLKSTWNYVGWAIEDGYCVMTFADKVA